MATKKKVNSEASKGGFTIDEIKVASREKFGDDIVTTLEHKPPANISGLSWGSPSINYVCTGNPFVGIVKGRSYEVFGHESSGKTTLCLHAIADAQRQGVPVAFIDAEQALDTKYATDLGVKKKDLLFTQPDYGEQAIDVVEHLVEMGVRLIVIDSVSALVPLDEIEANMEKAHIGLQARLMGKAIRKLSPKIKKSDSAIIWINQIRQKIGVMFGNPETTTGGLALKFGASVRLQTFISTAKSKAIIGATDTLMGKKDKERLGSNMRIHAVKNKVGPPYKECEVPLYYGLGLDLIADWYNFAVAMELLKKGRGAYIIEGIGRSKDVRISIDDMNKNLPKIQELIAKKYATH